MTLPFVRGGDKDDETIILGEGGEIVVSGGKKGDTIILQRRKRNALLQPVWIRTHVAGMGDEQEQDV
jgi:hypothetical protein